MFKGLGDMGKILAKAQEMQAEMGNMSNELREMTVDAEAGAGLVKVTATGEGEIRRIHIDPSLLTNDEQEILQDLIILAVNTALVKAKDLSRQHMQKISEKFGIPLPENGLGI